MKKKNVINLIKFHAEKNEAAFRQEAYTIAKDFDNDKDYSLAQYILYCRMQTVSVHSFRKKIVTS